jgi:MFS family permease
MIPSRRGWPLIGALFTTQVLLMGSGFNTIGVFFDPLMKEFHRNHTQVSLLATLIFITMSAGSLLAGWLLDRFPARLVMGAGAITCGLAFLTASQAQSFSVVAFSYFLLGAGMCLSTLTAVAVVIGNSFDPLERGSALGLAIAGNGAGGFLMIPIASVAVTHFGWRGGYLVLAAPMLLVALPLFLIFVRTQPRRIGESNAPSNQSDGMEFHEAIRNRALWLVISAAFLFEFALSMPLVHLIPYLIHLGYKPEHAATSMGTVQGITCLGTIVWGVLIDRFGARSMMANCTLIAAVSLAILLGAGDVLTLLAFVLIYGFILNAISPLLPCLLTESLGMRRFPLFMGIARFVGSSAVGLGPLMAGWLVDQTGGYSSAFSTAIVSALCAGGLTLAIPRARYRLSAVPLHAA